ncbi:hypothetical protein ACVW2L_001973 [Mucilaginibacter sp. HD30]
MAGTFQFLVICFCILVPACTVKVKVVAVKICAVKFHCSLLRCEYTAKNHMSIENFYFLLKNHTNQILFRELGGLQFSVGVSTRHSMQFAASS